MWKASIRNIVVIFQTTILRIVGFYVRHLANGSKKIQKSHRPQTISQIFSYGIFEILENSIQLQPQDVFDPILCQQEKLPRLKKNAYKSVKQ